MVPSQGKVWHVHAGAASKLAIGCAVMFLGPMDRNLLIASLATLLGLCWAACEVSEPLPPVAVIQTPLFRPYADPDVWAQTPEGVRRQVWDLYEREFQRLRQAKNFPELLRLAREAHALFPQERKAWLNLSTALLIMGDFGRTITAAEGALAREREERFAPDVDEVMAPQALCNIASAQIELSRLSEALATLDRALELRRDFPRTFLLRGEVLHRLDRDEEARVSLERGFALRPRPPDVVSSDHIVYALTLRDLGHTASAEAALRRAIEEMPHEFGFHHHLGLLLRDGGRVEQAFDEFQHEMLLRPDSPYQGQVATALGGLAQEARLHAGEASWETVRRLVEADALRAQGDFASALAVWQDLFAQRPASDESIYLPLMIARAHAALGDAALAAEWHRRVLDRDPTFVPSLVERAEALEALGQREVALDLLLMAQRLDPLSWRLLQHYREHPQRTEELRERALAQAAASAEDVAQPPLGAASPESRHGRR